MTDRKTIYSLANQNFCYFQIYKILKKKTKSARENGWQIRTLENKINTVPKYKILDWSELKRLADKKINVTKKLKSVLERFEKHCGKRRKCWLSAFSPFPQNIFKSFLSQGRRNLRLYGKGLRMF